MHQIKVECFSEGSYGCNCYAVFSGEEIALVDIGEATDEIIEFAKKNKDKIKYVLLTHCHYDHICGVERVLKETDAKLVIHKADAIGLENPEYSLSARVGFPQPQIKADIEVQNGDKLPLGDSFFEVLHTPGHTSGSICYLIEDKMLSGDTLFEGSIGRTDFISGSIEQMKSSLNILKNLGEDYEVFPGHGYPTTLFSEIETNYYFNL